MVVPYAPLIPEPHPIIPNDYNTKPVPLSHNSYPYSVNPVPLFHELVLSFIL